MGTTQGLLQEPRLRRMRAWIEAILQVEKMNSSLGISEVDTIGPEE